MAVVKTLLASLVKLDDVSGVLVSREGKAIFCSLPEVYSQEFQENLHHAIEEMSAAFDNAGRYGTPEEIVGLYENGSLVVREAHGFKILVILKTASPSPLVSVALNALALKFEKLAQNKPAPPKAEENIPLILFNEIVKLLAQHYGPAAKLMVKRALKQAGATEKGLLLSCVSSFLKALKQEIDDPKLAQKALNKAKELVRLRRQL